MTTAAARGAGRAASSWREQALAAELGLGVVRGEDVQRLTREGAGGVRGRGRQRREEPAGWDRRARDVRPSWARRARLTADVLVTIRYGNPVASSRPIASAAPGISWPAATMTPSMSSSSARVPARAARSSGVGRVGGRRGPASGRCGASSCSSADGRLPATTRCSEEHGWDCSTGRRRSSSGSPTTTRSPGGSPRRSMTRAPRWASARSRASSRSASGRSPSRSARRSSSRATSSPTRRSRRVFARWGETHDSLDILVHALAFARREDLEGDLRGHVARRVRAGAGRVGLLARRPDPCGAAATCVPGRPS